MPAAPHWVPPTRVRGRRQRGHWATASGAWVKPPAPPKPPVRRPVVDPFAPKTDAQLQAEARGMLNLGPILDEITGRYNRAGEAGQNRIVGATSQLAGLLSGTGREMQDIYGRARDTEQGTASQLAQSLGQFGQGLSDEQAHALALQDAPAQLQAGVPAAALLNARGAANAGLASQTAESQMLNTQGAAAGAYGAKLPGIAALTGLQHSRDLEARLAGDLEDELSHARQGAQESLASILQHLRDNEITKAEYRESGLFKNRKLAEDQRYHDAQLAYKRQKDARDRALKLKSLGISAARVAEYARHNGITEAQAEAKLIAQARRDREGARHNKQTEAAARARAKETHRHNKQTEKNKGKSKDGL